MDFVIRNPDGSTKGADPRTIPTAELEKAGHTNRPLLGAIRAKCIDCCAGSPYEVAACVSVNCALWPFRMGSNPWRKGRPLDPERARALRQRQLAKA